MDGSPRITIMIPTYNQTVFLRDAIDSALAQDYPNLEVVVSDDASPDDTADLVAAYTDKRLRYFRNERNLGRVGNYRRTLYEHATGDWTLNLDGDDYLVDPTFIRAAVSRIGRHDDAVMVIGGTCLLDFTGRRTDVLPTGTDWECVSGREFFLSWRFGVEVAHASALYKRSVATRIGFYGRDILGADMDSLLRQTLHGSVLLHGKVVAFWRQHGSNASKAVRPEARIANLESMLAPYSYALEQGVDPALLESWKRENLVAYSIACVKGCIHAGRRDAAREFLRGLQGVQPEIYRAVMSTLLFDGRFHASRLLLALGGEPLLTWGRICRCRLGRLVQG